jgi:glycosyltransferase involved in cell wall biosynthesis
MPPKLSIVTPSFRQPEWLKLCAASIADQQGVAVEHIVQDAGTGSELETWAASQPSLTLHVEKDSGMYDAVNRGLRKASGEILAYLNCDEQYLPGALAQVAQFFERHPETDVAFGHALVVDLEGKFLCCRKAIQPGRYHGWVSRNLATLTCSTFFRRKVIEDGHFFDPNLCAIGDAVWVMRLLNQRVRLGILPHITSTFLDHGSNMMLSERGVREQTEFIQTAPAWARALRPWIRLHYRLRKLFAGAYRQAPFSYTIYTRSNPRERTTFHVAKPTFRWIR